MLPSRRWVDPAREATAGLGDPALFTDDGVLPRESGSQGVDSCERTTDRGSVLG